MKYNEKFPVFIMALGHFVVFSNIAIVLYVLLSIFMKQNIPNNYIWGICILIIISIFQLLLNNWLKRINGISVRFSLDSLPGKQMAIAAELNSGSISEDEFKNKNNELQKEIELFNSISDYSRYFSKISKVTTISLIGIIAIFLLINGLKIFYINDNYIFSIIKYGLITQILLILPSVYVSMIIIKIK